MEIDKFLMQDATSYTATQTYQGGFSTYEQLVASDYWYFTMSLDLTEGLLADDKIIYQWATFVDQAASQNTFTVGCKRTVGDDTESVMDYFEQSASEVDALKPESALVVDQIWSAQAPDLRFEDTDTDWIGTDSAGVGAAEHTPEVSASATSGNKKYACKLAMEMPKIGRNPADFEKTYDITMGARLYDADDSTTFTTIPESTTTYFLDQPPSYKVAVVETGSYALFASSIAAIAVLFMAF